MGCRVIFFGYCPKVVTQPPTVSIPGRGFGFGESPPRRDMESFATVWGPHRSFYRAPSLLAFPVPRGSQAHPGPLPEQRTAEKLTPWKCPATDTIPLPGMLAFQTVQRGKWKC